MLVLDGDNWQEMTNAAKRELGRLEKAGYLHSDYSRFEEITDYRPVYYEKVLEKLGNKIIARQIEREQKIYKELGVSGINELNKMFKGDEAIQTFINGQMDNIYSLIAGTLKETKNDSNLGQKIVNKQKIENSIENSFNNALNNMTKDYQQNLSKIFNNGTLSQNMIEPLKKISNKQDNGRYKQAQSIASQSFSQWKGNMLEHCVGMLFSQIGKVKNVKITGSNLDQFGKYIKSDTTVFTDEINIGISAKNYKIETNAKGEKFLKNNLTLHSGGSFESFLERLESLRNEELQSNLNTITKRFRTDNYYYNLINEAANKVSFKNSNPAEDFMNIIKDLASAWFGTQLVTNTEAKTSGQNVDFLAVSNLGLIPMSILLKALREQTAGINVNISSTANINEEQVYQNKLLAPHGNRSYTGGEVQVGAEAGREMYKGIKVSPIRLRLILSQFI